MDGVTNIGVAAHIHAASEGGARYDPEMTSTERSEIANGIWLCQTHAKLVDDDEVSYPASLLREWKETSEHMAALEAKGFEVRPVAPFSRLEKQAPELIAEMRADLQTSPLTRQIIVLPNRRVMYTGGSTPYFAYFLDDHPEIMSILTILEHNGAVYEITFNNVPRFTLTESFVSYLVGD